MSRMKAGAARAPARPSALAVLASPLAFGMLLPIALLDASVFVYQHVCFPAFRIAKVPRHRYLVFDRGRLTYLGFLRRASAFCCSYADGVLAYAREVSARTEQYFSPIKHMRHPESPHSRYAYFAAFGNAAEYRRSARRLRGALRHPGHQGGE